MVRTDSLIIRSKLAIKLHLSVNSEQHFLNKIYFIYTRTRVSNFIAPMLKEEELIQI